MRIPLFILSLPLFITAADAQWEYGWARQSSSTTVEHGTSCAVAPDGHVAVTGSFIDTLHLGSIVVGTAPGNGIGGFVACYDATGNLEWAHGLSYHHPSGGNCQAWDVAVDAEGNVFAGGAFSDSLFLDGVKVLTAPDSLQPLARAFYVVKFTPEGDMAWAAPVGVGGYTGTLLAIAVDGNGDVYTTGSDGGQTGRFDKLDGASGAVLFHYTTVGAGAYINDVATDAANNVYILGLASNTFTMGELTCPYNSAWGGGSTRLFVGKFNSAGLAQWYYEPEQLGDGYVGFPENNLAVSADGHCFVETRKSIRINGDTITDGNLRHGLFALNPDGSVSWARKLNATGQFSTGDIHCDSEGNVLLAGLTFAPSVDLLDTVLYTPTNFNFFLGRFDGGTGALSGLLTGPVVAELPGLGMGSDDVPALCGTFAGGPIDLGDELSGSWNMFVARLQPADVGIHEQALDGIVMDLVPNPAHGAFKLRMGHAEGALDVDIIDACGAVVLARTFDGLTPMVELNVPPGLYLVRAMDKAGHVAEGRLVEQ
jgi:hypothetical protein